MHGSIQDRLEDLLATRGVAASDKRLVHHLSTCQECSSELNAMKAQSELLTSLRPPAAAQPTPGFYGRVMQRIEESARESIWAAFIYSPFSKRVMYASLTLALMLGTYVVAHESRDGHLQEGVIAETLHYDAPVIGDQAQQRDAVLANFASHQGPLQ